MRNYSAEALGLIGKAAKPATAALIRSLNDPEPRVRTSAAFALGRIGAGDSVPELIAAMRDDDARVRRLAACSLGLLGSDARAAAPCLEKALADEDEDVCAGAQLALENIQGA